MTSFGTQSHLFIPSTANWFQEGRRKEKQTNSASHRRNKCTVVVAAAAYMELQLNVERPNPLRAFQKASALDLRRPQEAMPWVYQVSRGLPEEFVHVSN